MNALSLYVKTGIVLAAVLAVAGAAYLLYDAGRQDVTDEVERSNIEAGEAANDAAMSWRRCRDAGGVFDFASGECRRSP